MSKEKLFIQELKSLLKKYDATIRFDCAECSDLLGIVEEKIVADFDTSNTSVVLSNGYSVDANELPT